MTDNNKSPLKIRKWETAANVIGFIMSFISMLFTVRLMRSFATDNTSALLYQAFGCTVQAAQVVLFVYAVYLQWQRQNGKAVVAFVLFCLLFVLSLAGTLGSFIVSNRVQNNRELNSDVRLKELQKRADSIDDQISNSQDLIDRFAKKAIITKGVKPESARLDRLNAERSALSDQIANFKAEGTSDSLYTGLSNLLGADPEAVKLWLFGLYAIALDLVSAVLLAFSIGVLGGQNPTRANPANSGYHAENTAYPGANPNPEPAFQMAGKSPETAHHQDMETVARANPVQYSTVQSTSGGQSAPIGFIRPGDTGPDQGAGAGQGTGSPIPGVDRAEIVRYIREAYGNDEKPDTLTGRRKIADRTGIPNKATDKIHALLKRRGVVRVSGTKTIPLMSRAEALAAVRV